MKRIFVITALVVMALSNLGTTSSVPYPLQNRVKDADVIVIGELEDIVVNRFSIVHHEYVIDSEVESGCGPADHEYRFDAGALKIESVLKGELPSGRPVYVAFRTDYEMRPPGDPPCRWMSPDPGLKFYEGQRGIWILRKNRVFLREYLGATYYDAVVSLDSLGAITEYITKDRYVKSR
jgi:hypothetical protein